MFAMYAEKADDKNPLSGLNVGKMPEPKIPEVASCENLACKSKPARAHMAVNAEEQTVGSVLG